MDSPTARSVVQVQPMPASTQRATLVASPSATSLETNGSRGLLPALEQLQRISHQRSPSSGSGSALPPLSSRGAFPVDEGGVTPGPSAPPHQHLYQRLTGLPHPPTTAATAVTGRPPVHPSSTSAAGTSVSSISQPQQGPSLPTYRQANSYPGDGGDSRPLPPSSPSSVLPSSPAMDPSLPDLLHSHMVPPQVPPARPNQHRHQRRSTAGSRGVGGDGQRRHHRRSQQQQQQQQHGRQRRRSRTMSGGSTTTASPSESGMCKEPCVRCVVKVTSFRWVLVLLSILGVCCVVTGVVLAALRAAGNSFLFLAIMFIGKSLAVV
ncbi:hypothetical protein ElyMa_002711600 [Elysia marginata]|uniref:Uncharacterized protein n=1 Tax=Elysia marginata TaxID=1093978 RepID=A0AAV4HH78_9GAST|nr:hypothetical protein ElyMa_002711600 [Elysia marginata]